MNRNTIRLLDVRALVAVSALALLAVLLSATAAAAAGAKASKPWNQPNVAVQYAGKTKSGHDITFTLKKNGL
ncbi:MAG: hypothetical protein U0R71_09510 [Solirubrobacterales bacterium]